MLRSSVEKRVAKLGKGRHVLLVFIAASPFARAAEHVTLKNGSEFDCVRRETADGERVRLVFAAGNFLEVAAAAVAAVETVPDVVVAAAVKVATPTIAEIMAKSGAEHRIDADLLASVVKAESGGRVTAVSRTGAKGLMQLMPGTATELGVKDAFQADQNISGGTAYLDQLLTRYHDNVALALAAYNAGPGAVDKYHGVPPFTETREYVRRVITEFNRRKLALLAAK